MKIRPFNVNDSEVVIKLWESCGLTRPWNKPRLDIERKVALQDDGFVVAEQDGNIIGSVMFGYDGHRGNVYYLAVRPDWQRQQFRARADGVR